MIQRKNPQSPNHNRCLLCNSTAHRKIYTCEFGHEIHMCRDCGFLFAAGHLDRSAIQSLLRDGYSQRAGPLEEAWAAPYRLEAAERRIEFLKAYVDPPKAPRVLEIGSYIGHFLCLGAAAGWQMEGVEPEERTALFAREKTGAIVHACLVEEFVKGQPQQFDGICLFHVLEHLPDPIQMLRDLRRSLTEDGWLCMEVPNGDLCGEGDWPRFFNADETHLWFFSTWALRAVLGRAGFRMEEVKVVPAYAGAKGALLVFAQPEDKMDGETQRNSELAQLAYRRLQLMRLNWLYGTGPWRRLYNHAKYMAWYVIKGHRQAKRA
jgi:SAM-dependent methyltransferase